MKQKEIIFIACLLFGIVFLSGCSETMFILGIRNNPKPSETYELVSLNGSLACIFQDTPLNQSQLNTMCDTSNDWHLISSEFDSNIFQNTCCNSRNFCINNYVTNLSNPCPIIFTPVLVNNTFVNGSFYKFGGCCFWG